MTGVQTCALPICVLRRQRPVDGRALGPGHGRHPRNVPALAVISRHTVIAARTAVVQALRSLQRFEWVLVVGGLGLP